MKIPQINFRPQNEQNIGIEIIELSSIYSRFDSDRSNFSFKPHRINFNSLLYITAGNGFHFIDFNTYTLQPGSVVFINSNQVHAFDLVNKPQGKIIVFTDEFLNNIYSSIKTPLFSVGHLQAPYSPTLLLSEHIKQTCDALLFEINKEFQNKTTDNRFLHLVFSALLTKITSIRPQYYEQYLSESHTRVFNQFMLLLENNFTSNRDASLYADMLHITYKSLNQICKLATKKTPKQLIDAHIILEAKRRLSIEKSRTQQLADELGFEEVTNFVKYFKKHTLLTPTQFKKSISG